MARTLLGAGPAITANEKDEHATAYKLFGRYQLNRYVGLQHRVQMTAAPGPTVTVNGQGEPRG